MIPTALNQRPDSRPVDLAHRDRVETRSIEQLPGIQVGPESQSRRRQWGYQALDGCKKGSLAEEVVEQYDAAADSAYATHLAQSGERIGDDADHVGGVDHVE